MLPRSLVLVLWVAAPAWALAVSSTAKKTTIWSAMQNPKKSVGDLKRGERLPLKTELPGWFEVTLKNGSVGFVRQQYTELVPDAPGTASFQSTPVSTAAEVPSQKPAAGKWRLHLIDVGTGLAVLVQGADFTLLFDGGSKDDKAGIRDGKSGSRLLAYLYAALGPSGAAECAETGIAGPGQGEVTIDHLVLSHPHDDHGNLLDEVLRCYRVKNVWDSGRINDTVFYREFLEGVAAEPEVVYHTASSPPAGAHTLIVGGVSIALPEKKRWLQFDERDEVALGAGAKLTILHADAESHSDPNGNSIVMRLDLGGTSVLLTGDSESGEREAPTAALGDIEQGLVDHHATQIDVDILQVGHHGSKTSSRKAFLEAVSPKLALIGAGPYKYGTVTLPDPIIVQTFTSLGVTMLNTNKNDGKECEAGDRIGLNNAKPGGCDNYVIDIGP